MTHYIAWTVIQVSSHNGDRYQLENHSSKEIVPVSSLNGTDFFTEKNHGAQPLKLREVNHDLFLEDQHRDVRAVLPGSVVYTRGPIKSQLH